MGTIAPLFRAAVGCALLSVMAACTQHGHDGEKMLNVYSWADYIAPDTVANFERETGIKVRYDTYENNEVLETKLLTGHTNYDVVLPSGNFLEHQLSAGVYRKLDKSLLPNLANADPEIMRWIAVHDPGNLYAIPYMWSTAGLGYNIDKARARLGLGAIDSWSLLFNPENAAKLQDCGIAIIDSARDVFASAIIFLGHDPNRQDVADLTAASEVLRKIRPFIRYIDPAQHTSDLANGNICLSLAWSGIVRWIRFEDARAEPRRKVLLCQRGKDRNEHYLPGAPRRINHSRGHHRDSCGRAAPAQRASMAELSHAARRQRRNYQCHQISER